MKLAWGTSGEAEEDEDSEQQTQLCYPETFLHHNLSHKSGATSTEKGNETDLFGEIIDLGDQRALLNVHFSPMLLEIADRASVHLSLRSADAFKTTDILAQASKHFPHRARLFLDVTCVERRICLERAETVHDRAVDRLARMHVYRRRRKWEVDLGRGRVRRGGMGVYDD